MTLNDLLDVFRNHTKITIIASDYLPGDGNFSRKAYEGAIESIPYVITRNLAGYRVREVKVESSNSIIIYVDQHLGED